MKTRPVLRVEDDARRRFLRGAGGAALALPILPSLYASDAQAQAAATQRNFVMLRTDHGGAYQRHMFPAASTLTERQTYAGHEIRRGALVGSVAGGETRLSDVLRAPSSTLTASLIAKMNVINGIDVPYYMGHNRAAALGNFADSDQVESTVLNGAGRMTIDQIMGWSSSFYADLSKVKERVLVHGWGSWVWSNPTARTGTLQRAERNVGSNVELFDKLFATTTAPTRPLIVDRVIEDYRRLSGNPRLSAQDKRRLTEHMDRLFELQRKLQLSGAVVAPSRPTADTGVIGNAAGYAISPDRHVQAAQLYFDIVAAAFSAGASRIYVHIPDHVGQFSNFGGDWHQDIAHQTHASLNAANIELASYQTYFSRAVLDFVSKLNAVSNGVGGTLLDNSLVVWTHESGNFTHDSTSVPFITFGSASGWLRTGQYLDYRNLTKTIGTDAPVQNEPRWNGLLMHQWCGTALQSMGIPKSQYENLSQNGGYPDFNYRGRDYPASAYPDSVWNATGDLLPWMKA
jgi:hypothetical protein